MLVLLLVRLAFAAPCAQADHVAATCPHAVAVGMLDTCAAWTPSQRSCVEAATGCDAFTACFATTPTAGPAPGDTSCGAVCARLYQGAGTPEQLASCDTACGALMSGPRRACYVDQATPALMFHHCGKVKSPEAESCFAASRAWCGEGCCADGETCDGGACVPAASIAAAPDCAATCGALTACSSSLDRAKCEEACGLKLDATQRTCFATTACAAVTDTCGSLANPR